MEFKIPYLQAMRQQAPKMFNRLRRTGVLDAHVQAKSEEAHRMLAEMTDGLPENDINGRRMAEEVVFATMIEFPQDETPET